MVVRWTAALGCLVVMAAASDSAPPPAAAPPAKSAEDPILGARRDLEAIKALRGPGADLARPDAPMMVGPDLVPVTPGSATQRPSTGNTSRRGKGTSAAPGTPWLLDAMTKKGERTPTGKVTAESSGVGEDAERLVGADGKAGAEGAREPARRDERRPSGTVVNPLSAFMADWMAPQDYTLLRAGWSTPSSRDGVVDTSVAVPLPGTNDRLTRDRGLASASTNAGNVRPRENPFLAALANPTGPTAAASQPLAAPPPTPVKPMVERAPVSAPPPVVAPAAPALAKPADDAKYFKPLKKF